MSAESFPRSYEKYESVSMRQVQEARKLLKAGQRFGDIMDELNLPAVAVFCLDTWCRDRDDETAKERMTKAARCESTTDVNRLAAKEGWT